MQRASVQGKCFCASYVPAVEEDTERSLTPSKGWDFIPNRDGWDEGAWERSPVFLLGYISKLLGIFGERKKKRKEDAEGRVKNRESYHRKKKKRENEREKLSPVYPAFVEKEFTKPTGFLKTLNGKKRKAFFSFRGRKAKVFTCLHLIFCIKPAASAGIVPSLPLLCYYLSLAFVVWFFPKTCFIVFALDRCSVLLWFEQKDCACSLSLPCFIVWIICLRTLQLHYFFLILR